MKKLIAMLLVLALAVSCFVGCEKTPADDTKGTTPVDTKGDTTPTETTEPVVEDRFDGKHDIVELTWVIRNNPQENDEKVVAALNKILEERYNLHLNLIAYPNAEFHDKMTLKITGNEPWDLCYSASWTNNYADRVEMGAFYDLNELMDSPVWAELMEVYPEGFYNNAIIDGHLYGLPNYQITYSPSALYVQKDLADKYGLPYKTGDAIKDVYDAEFYKWMEAVRDGEKDIWPLRAANIEKGVWKGYWNYDTAAGAATLYHDDETLTAHFIHENEAVFEWYKKQRDLLYDGIIREDHYTVTDDTADFKANRYAAHINTGKPGGEVSVSNTQGEDYIMIYLYDNEYYTTPGGGMSTITCLNYASKDPEAALKLLTVFWTDEEVYNTFLFGIENENYKKTGENRVELIPDSGYDRSGWGWGIANQCNQWLLPGQADDVWEQTIAMNAAAKNSVLEGFTYSSANVTTESGAMKTVISEYGKQYWNCETDAELKTWWDNYNKAMKDAGADALVKDLQEQVDAWAKANGKK